MELYLERQIGVVGQPKPINYRQKQFLITFKTQKMQQKKMQQKKMSLENIKGKLSRTEMKKIMAGSSCQTDSDCGYFCQCTLKSHLCGCF
jgi:hypothetical protein